MKISTNSFILLVICFTSIYKTCNGLGIVAIGSAIGGAVLDWPETREKIEKFLRLYVDEAAIDRELKNRKLDDISFKVVQSEKNLQKSFREVLAKFEENANYTISAEIAIKLENALSSMDIQLRNIVLYAKKAKNGLFSNDKRNNGILNYYSQIIKSLKTDVKVIFQRKGHSLDYLEYVKTKAYNVCKHKMSQLQMLDIYRVLYVNHMIRYTVSELLIIAIHEKLGDHDENNNGKKTVYEEVQDDFNKDLILFQNIMLNASREFQTCDAPKIYHTSGGPYQDGPCYLIDPKNRYQPPTGIITDIRQSLEQPGKDPICWYYFSLGPVNAKPGYVVVGAKIERHLNILYIRVLQAKLLPNGAVDSKTVSYNDDTKHGIGEPVRKIHVKNIPKLAHHAAVIDLTETVASDDRVVTGLGFAVSKKGHVYLEVTTKVMNLQEGILDENTTRPEVHRDGTREYNITRLSEVGRNVVRSSIGLQSVKPDQHLIPRKGYNKGAHPYIDGDDIFPTPLTPLSGVSLYVREVQGHQGFLSLRLHTFDIVPHIGINVNENQNFIDILESV